MAGVLSSDGPDSWIGGETVVVQLGDILDRGEDEIAILSLLRSLDIQAKSSGGAVFQMVFSSFFSSAFFISFGLCVLRMRKRFERVGKVRRSSCWIRRSGGSSLALKVNGNHETMNVEGDFRYVDPGAFEECIDFVEYLEEHDQSWEQAFVGWIGVSERWKEDRRASQGHWNPWNLVQRQKGIVARSSLLKPGGPLSCELARHAVILKVDDWVFCHGGLLPHHVAYGIDKMNKEVSYWMQGLHENNDGPQIPFIATRGYDSVVWNRLYSRDTTDIDYSSWKISSILEETLQAVGAKRMVVGHTPQFNGANSKYNKKIWRIDVGMSSGVLHSRPEVLEIIDGKARVLRKIDDSTLSQAMDYL